MVHDNFLNRLGSNLAYSPVALPFHPIQGKRRERLHDVLPTENTLNLNPVDLKSYPLYKLT
jgi:hypothetical protein